MITKMSNFNVASVKQILLASLDLPNTSQQSILISCTDASTVTKVSPERNIMKSMLKDVAAKQEENLKFDCDQCEKTFDNKRLLARHKRNNHVTEKFTCETCHGTFWSQHTLGNHIS